MSGCGTTRGGSELRRWTVDVLAALALFWGAVFLVSGDHSRAHAVPLPSIAKQSASAAAAPVSARSAPSPREAHRPEAQASDRLQALALLSIAFAAIAALNLAFLRHLRRAYASPRRSVWRREPQG